MAIKSASKALVARKSTAVARKNTAVARKSTLPAKTSIPTMGGEAGLNRYLSEIRKFPLLAPEQEYMLAKRWADEMEYTVKSGVADGISHDFLVSVLVRPGHDDPPPFGAGHRPRID